LTLLREESEKGYVIPTLSGSIYIIIGEIDEGFYWLEKAYDELDPWLSTLKSDPLFSSVRSDPRYIALLKKMNLDK